MTRHYCWVASGESHIEMARQSMSLAGSGSLIQVDRFDMLENVKAQAEFLCSVNDGDEVVFLDNDALMAKPLPELGDYDLCVTWRDNMGAVSMLMPYNYGVVMCKRSFDTIAAWLWMCDHITHQTPKNQNWYGNQVALRELVGGIGREYTDHGYFKLRTKFLPCEQYNWTPEDVDEDITDKYVIHCKGNRKDLLEHYYQRITDGNQSP